MRVLAADPVLGEQYVWAHIDGTEFEKYVGQFGIALTDMPTVFVFDFDNEVFYNLHTQSEEVLQGGDTAARNKEGRVSQFLRMVLAGEIESVAMNKWYAPTTYIKKLEKFVSGFDEPFGTLIMAAIVLLIFGNLLSCLLLLHLCVW